MFKIWLGVCLVLVGTQGYTGQYPDIVNYAIRIHTTEHAGWGISTDQGLITAKHVVKNSLKIYWQTRLESGVGTIGYVYNKLDLAYVTATLPDNALRVKFAKHVPEIGDSVYYRCYLAPGFIPSVRQGWYLGIDSEGIIHIDGGGGPGSSGSGVYTTSGEVIGILVAGVNPIEAEKVMELALLQRTSVRSDMLAISLVGGMPKER